jgi:MIP family channel proteins
VEEQDALRRGVAEFVGAFTLIFIGGGAGIVSGHDIVAVALANGLAIGIMVSNLGHISGGHFNPAITFAFLVTRRIKPALAVIYWAAQLAGGTLGALLVQQLLPRASTDPVALGVPAIGHGVNAGAAFGLEAIMTFFLAWVVFATAVDPRGTFKSIAGLAIGLTITMDILFGGPFTGAAMNPARAFGPELIGNHWADAWVWYAGPILGATVAAVLYELLYLRPMPLEPVGSDASGVREPRASEPI